MAAAYIKDKTLTIKVESPAVGQEIRFHEMEIVKRILKKLPQSTVQHIRFTV